MVYYGCSPRMTRLEQICNCIPLEYTIVFHSNTMFKKGTVLMANFDEDVNRQKEKLAAEPKHSVEKTINSYAFRGGWLAMSSAAWSFISENSDYLGVAGFKVMGYLASRLGYDNSVVVNQSELAKQCRMTRNSVSKALKKLLAMKIILEGPKVGTQRSFQFNPHATWRGPAKAHWGAVKKAPHLHVVK